MLNLGSTQVGMILLFGLFFYDIFWVFFTPVMVTVAKNIDGPIKLLFPTSSSWEHFNMLGLGDIVIPGMDVRFAVPSTARFGYKLATAISATCLVPHSRCTGLPLMCFQARHTGMKIEFYCFRVV